MRKWAASLGTVIGALAVAQVADAHEFVCEKLVNGMSAVDVSTYPTTLEYLFRVTNSHDTHASTALEVSDPALLSSGYAFTPAAPFTLAVGASATDTYSVTLTSRDECLAFAAKDGVADNVFINAFVVKWDSGQAVCTARVSCGEAPPPPPPPPPEGGATRTPGFFKTHEQALATCLSGGAISLGFITISELSEALGLLWGSPASYDTGDKRSELDHKRFILARHTLVGVCNTRLFGTLPSPVDLLTQATTALGGTDCDLMGDLAEDVDAFNNSGDDEEPPATFTAGPATPKHAQSIADDPTMPSDQQCSN